MFHLFGYTIYGAKKHNHKIQCFSAKEMQLVLVVLVFAKHSKRSLAPNPRTKCCCKGMETNAALAKLRCWTIHLACQSGLVHPRNHFLPVPLGKSVHHKTQPIVAFCMIQRALWLPCIPHLPAQGDCNSRTSKCCGVPYTKHDFCDTKKIMAVCMYKLKESFASVCSVIFVL